MSHVSIGDSNLWPLKRRWYWRQHHNDVVQKVLRKARKGTQITYIVGNHDEIVRNFLGLAFGGIEIRKAAIGRISLDRHPG